MQVAFNPSHFRRNLLLLFVVIAIVSTQILAWDYYRTKYLGPSRPNTNASINLSVSTLINYGNGIATWYNRSDVPRGFNFYNLTLQLATVQAYYHSGLKEHYVQSINGVAENFLESPRYWGLWKYCQQSHAWEYSPVGADDIQLTNGDVLAWFFSDSNTVPPEAGAQVVSSC